MDTTPSTSAARESRPSDFDVREAGGDDARDRARVIALVSAMFRADATRRYEWLYRANPHGVARSWLAIERATGDAVGVT